MLQSICAGWPSWRSTWTGTVGDCGVLGPAANLDRAASWRSARCLTNARIQRGFLRGGLFASPGPLIVACIALPVAESG